MTSDQVVSQKVPIARLRAGDYVTDAEGSKYLITDTQANGRELTIKGPDGEQTTVEFPRGWHLDVVKWGVNN